MSRANHTRKHAGLRSCTSLLLHFVIPLFFFYIYLVYDIIAALFFVEWRSPLLWAGVSDQRLWLLCHSLCLRHKNKKAHDHYPAASSINLFLCSDGGGSIMDIGLAAVEEDVERKRVGKNPFDQKFTALVSKRTVPLRSLAIHPLLFFLSVSLSPNNKLTDDRCWYIHVTRTAVCTQTPSETGRGARLGAKNAQHQESLLWVLYHLACVTRTCVFMCVRVCCRVRRVTNYD